MKLTIMEDNKTPQDIEQYQEHYSESGLFEKIKKVCKKAGMKAIYYVLLLYYVLMDENTPWKHKSIIIGTLGYFILPLDLVPDFIPGLGFTDDIAAITACLHTVKANITPEIKKKARMKLYEWFMDIHFSKIDEYDEEIG
jgi:uncharacterized membrane protein YkvA (DUF1232 family)